MTSTKPVPTVTIDDVIPAVKRKPLPTTANVVLTPELLGAIDALAEELGLRRSELVRHLIVYSLRQLGRIETPTGG